MSTSVVKMGSSIPTPNKYTLDSEGKLFPKPETHIHSLISNRDKLRGNSCKDNPFDTPEKQSKTEITTKLESELPYYQVVEGRKTTLIEKLDPEGFAKKMIIYMSNNFELSPYSMNFLLDAISLIIEESNGNTTHCKHVEWGDCDRNYTIMSLIISLLVCIPENSLYVSFNDLYDLSSMWDGILVKMREMGIKTGPRVREGGTIVLYVDSNPSVVDGIKNPHSLIKMNRKWTCSEDRSYQAYNLAVFGQKMYCWKYYKHEDWDEILAIQNEVAENPDALFPGVIIQFVLPWRVEMS